jgi:hypothetical protein
MSCAQHTESGSRKCDPTNLHKRIRGPATEDRLTGVHIRHYVRLIRHAYVPLCVGCCGAPGQRVVGRVVGLTLYLSPPPGASRIKAQHTESSTTLGTYHM